MSRPRPRPEDRAGSASGALVVVIGLLAVAGLIVALQLAPTRKGARVAVGFNDNAVTEDVATPEQTALMISAAGARIDRVQVNWSTLEPAPGRYEFATYDAIYRADLAQGVRTLFVFGFAPGWATNGRCDASRLHCPPAPDHYLDAARTAALIATRYPKLAGIEIWNEPNTPYFWAPAADPAAYTGLLRACYRAIKRANPSMPVAGGSMSSTPGGGIGYLDAADFLRGIYLHGGGVDMDAISVHAYPDQPDVNGRAALAVVTRVRGVRDQFGHQSTPIWVTETGISTTGSDAVPPDVQSLALLHLYDRLRDESGVTMVLVHTLVQPPGPPSDRETGYGIVGPGPVPHPAYCALSAAWGGHACSAKSGD